MDTTQLKFQKCKILNDEIIVLKKTIFCLGLVAMIAGGWDININKVELYSPNGKCNVELTSLPVNLFAAHILTRYNDKIFACAGHVPWVCVDQCNFFENKM